MKEYVQSVETAQTLVSLKRLARKNPKKAEAVIEFMNQDPNFKAFTGGSKSAKEFDKKVSNEMIGAMVGAATAVQSFYSKYPERMVELRMLTIVQPSHISPEKWQSVIVSHKDNPHAIAQEALKNMKKVCDIMKTLRPVRAETREDLRKLEMIGDLLGVESEIGVDRIAFKKFVLAQAPWTIGFIMISCVSAAAFVTAIGSCGVLAALGIGLAAELAEAGLSYAITWLKEKVIRSSDDKEDAIQQKTAANLGYDIRTVCQEARLVIDLYKTAYQLYDKIAPYSDDMGTSTSTTTVDSNGTVSRSTSHTTSNEDHEQYLKDLQFIMFIIDCLADGLADNYRDLIGRTLK